MSVIYTPPRALPVRFIRARDQVAWIADLNADGGAAATQVRAVQTASRADVRWLEVLAPPSLVEGEAGAFVLIMAERYADGRHGPVVEVTADEAQCLVIRERVAVSMADAYEPASVIGAGVSEDMCGAWVEPGYCALGIDHPADMPHATRNGILSTIAAEGHRHPAGGVTVATTQEHATA